MKYKKHIFFDLDRTLWDFETNSHESLLELCVNFKLEDKGIVNYEDFITIYKFHNEKLWELYQVDRISQIDLRRERFQRSLLHFGVNDFELAKKIGEEYIEICPRKNKLFPYTFELLDYLKENYYLHIITNGFDTTQHIKLECSDLMPYFHKIITSEKSGVKKPNPQIFKYALDAAGSTKNESIYVGDNLVIDILACQNFGIDGIYFNPDNKKHNEKVSYEVNCLSQIMDLL
tara:strand:- start:282 stop:977 length:696 start_codon:yes stop_codon:yes gene_type:complete